MALTNIAKVLQHAEIPSHIYKSDADRAEMKRAVQDALHELSCGLSGSAYNLYTMGCSIEGGDAEWRETGTLEEMQTICALAALVNFCINEQERLNN